MISGVPSGKRHISEAYFNQVNNVEKSYYVDEYITSTGASGSDDTASSTSHDENPSIFTKLLYVNGQSLVPRYVCQKNGEGLLLMIAITSAPSHLARRNAIRSTWGTIPSRRSDIDLAFFVGTSKNQEENDAIAKESFTYGDIVQVNKS